MSEYDDSRSGSGGGPGPDDGSGGPAGHDPLEERLSAAMHAEGDAVDPGDRLDAIRSQAGEQTSGRRGGWLWPVATAAAVAAIALIAWVGLRPGQTGPAPVATSTQTSTATTSSAPQTTPTTPTTPATGTTSAPPVSPSVSPATGGLPVYLLAPQPGRPADWRLVRQFRQVPVPAIADQGQSRVAASVNTALDPPADPNGFVTAFPSGTSVMVTEVASNVVSLLLSHAGRSGLTTAQQQAAVQQIVWSATAALGRTVPVAITVASGGNLFESMPAGVYKREPTQTAYTVLAPIWIDTPGPGAAVTAPVVVKGQACVFEAALSWTLTSGGARVAAGHAQATSGCPTQGSWTVDLGQLTKGSYRFTAQAFSAENGSVNAQNIVDFTVG